MTILAGFAYSLVAYGLPLSLFATTVARQPHEVIIMIVGAFFWLLSLLFSSIVWISVPPLRHEPAFTLPFSILFQEAFRWLFYKLVRKADKLLEIVSDDKTQLRKHKVAYVGGLGFGMISGIVSFANVVEAASGPGVVGITGGVDSRYFVLVSAFGALAMIILHTCWGVLWFDGWDNIRQWQGAVKVVSVLATHLIISCLSLANTRVTPLLFLIAAYITSGVLVSVSLFIAGLRPSSIKHFFSR